MKKTLSTMCIVALCLVCFASGAVFWNYFRPDRYRLMSLEYRAHGWKNTFKIDTITGKIWKYNVDKNSPPGFYPVNNRTVLSDIVSEIKLEQAIKE